MYPRWIFSVVHCIMALPMIAFGFVAFGSFNVGAALACFWFHAREKGQYDQKMSIPYIQRAIGATWLPWTWGKESAWDFYAPAISSIVIALILSFLKVTP